MNSLKDRIAELETRVANVKYSINVMLSSSYNERNKHPNWLHIQEYHLEALEKELQTLYLEDAIYE